MDDRVMVGQLRRVKFTQAMIVRIMSKSWQDGPPRWFVQDAIDTSPQFKLLESVLGPSLNEMEVIAWQLKHPST